MKQTIVAIITPNIHNYIEDIESITNESYIREAKQHGEIISLKEFQSRYNADEIDFNSTIIRFIEAELEVKTVK